MKKTIKQHALTMLRRALGYGIAVTLVSLIAIAVFVLNNRDDLHLWHVVDLDEEFTVDSEVADFAGYLELEDRLFAQLDAELYAKIPRSEGISFNRYEKGSLMDPTSMATNWNRTFELHQASPVAGVLLLHGMSDSPYSLRHLGQAYHDAGASVIGLRIPGHGTAPSGLVETTWQDMAAAVRLAAIHLKEAVGDQPLYLVGYSNGGALAVIYALESLDDGSLPRPEGLVLVSPEIGVSWPREIFSLSHVALPFPEDDPYYGSGGGGETPTLGNMALRGERGTLVIGATEMLRQRWNPFYAWMERRSLEFAGLEESEEAGGGAEAR